MPPSRFQDPTTESARVLQALIVGIVAIVSVVAAFAASMPPAA